MSRPQSQVLLNHTDHSNGKVTEIITGEGMFYLTYRGQVFNLKESNAFVSRTPKYLKVAYPNRGHAQRLAEKLNRQFNCNDFEVCEFHTHEKQTQPANTRKKPQPTLAQPHTEFNDIAKKLLEASKKPRVAPVTLTVKGLRELK